MPVIQKLRQVSNRWVMYEEICEEHKYLCLTKFFR